MLTQIKLTNFKCFKEETAIPLSKFNLFTGVNGAGKSTALQALLLMRQSIEHNPYTTELILNGSCVLLGSFDDVRNRDVSASEPIVFKFYIHNVMNDSADFNGSINYQLEHKNDNMSLHISNLLVEQNTYKSKLDYKALNSINLHFLNGVYQNKPDEPIGCFFLIKLTPYNAPLDNSKNVDQNRYRPLIADEFSKYAESFNWTTKSSHFTFGTKYEISGGNKDQDDLRFEKIHFISADRIGPQEFYLKSVLPNFQHVGTKGEFTVNLLDKLAQELVNETLCLGDDAKTLITQTQTWLGKILNPLKLEVPRSKTNILELFIGDSKPSNVGFGYTSILPIIVTGLIAKPGEKIIIENPEIHLHPKAQTTLIEFLVKVANTGVQIFIESHSDHVLNALRLATKEKVLLTEDTSILFFNKNAGNDSAEVTSILIDEKGKLHKKTSDGMTAKIPKGFFDEWTNSMAKLF
ncbi:DUF3696 domain-containing protein [Methylocucumis oryzae]|uniref:AAA domain-containing protein n=1 Tax=Methylocucumis oryzae TaxID=1632867 RepID=A0A0F3IM18_9GAMM|nr:DUF3696 domain-containing protein [Methylocucumis oryzae]KJV06589.1 hypothetical protein VZ94_10335 [Methylocucumis oryzae]